MKRKVIQGVVGEFAGKFVVVIDKKVIVVEKVVIGDWEFGHHEDLLGYSMMD